MPDFILDHGPPDAARRLQKLDSFTQGYVEAMFFTDTGHLEDEDLEHATVGELSEDAWAQIEHDCAEFQLMVRALLAEAYTRADYDEAAAGRDFWYTRNGHGVGFWDREQLDRDGLGKELSKHCGFRSKGEFKETGLYRGDDGKLYLL